jgi:outer membrane protein TolC
MTNPSNLELHEPDPWFRDYLEGQLRGELRRGRRIRQIRQFAIVFVSLIAGSSVGVASAQIRRNTQRDSVLEAAQVHAGIDETRLSVARAELALVQKKFDTGIVGRDAVTEAYAQLRSAEVDLEIDALNIEEIRATKLPPRDDLNAPVVGGRDFVKLRLQLRMMVLQQRLDAAQEQAKEQQRRLNAGAVDRLAVLESQAVLQKAQADLTLIARKIELRDQYVTKQTTFEALSRTINDLELRNEYQVAAQGLQLASERLDLMQKRRAAGAAQDVDVLRAELEVRERQIEVRNLMNRISKKP